MVCSMQTVHLSCIKIRTISKQIEPRFPLSLFTKEYHRVRPKQFLSLWCIRHKPCTYLAPKLILSPKRPKWDLYDTRHLEVLLVASKYISKHMVRSMQFLHLSCIKISTISKQSKLSFHLSLFTQEYHRVHPKWFLSLWCIRHKLCTYLAPKLTLSPNRPKRDSIWHMSSLSSIGVLPNGFLCIWYVPCKPCTYLASRLALSPKKLNRPSTSASSPRSTIGNFHNDFWAYGALGTNHATILHQN